MNSTEADIWHSISHNLLEVIYVDTWDFPREYTPPPFCTCRVEVEVAERGHRQGITCFNIIVTIQPLK